MINQYGISNLDRGKRDFNNLISDDSIIFYARVVDIVLNQFHPQFNTYGGWNGIGTIVFEPLTTSNKNVNISLGIGGEGSTNIATSFFPQFSIFPLVNEIVTILKGPNNNLEERQPNFDFYYFPALSIWNHPHQNALPNPISNNNLPSYQKKDYQQTQVGSVRRVTDNSTEIDLNSTINTSQDTFPDGDNEITNIHPLLPFAGDVIHQGRWGNSIRLGSTAKPVNLSAQNNWSENGKNGNPITIIRNGQNPNVGPRGWISITENINDDLSSIYLTSTQKLKNFRVAGNENYGAFPSSVQLTPPSLYTNSQIAINSNRVVINAKEDSILLSAKNTLSVSVENSVGITTPAFYVGSNKVRLGGSDAKEPILKGNITVSLLKSLVESVEKLAQILEVEKNWPQGALVTSNNTVATNVKTTLQDLLNQLDLDESKSDSLKSYTSKVK